MGVRVGDVVLTRARNGTEFYTKVHRNALEEGNFSFLKFQLDDSAGSSLTVTESHSLITYVDSDTPAIYEARDVKVGQRFMVGSKTFASVISIEHVLWPQKYSLAT